MIPTLADVRALAESLWPAALAEGWDASGLASGRDGAPVRRVLLAVDAVARTVGEAVEIGADLLVTHHPLLLRGVHSVAEEHAKGALLARLIRADCALLTAHTNADAVPDGVSDVLAHRLGLVAPRPIVPGEDPETGLGRVGRLSEPTALGDFARRVAAVLPSTAGGVRVAGDAGRRVATVSLCGGAGDSLLAHPAVVSSDVYVTSDLRHHPASEALEQAAVSGGPALMDVSHWASESLWLEAAAEHLRDGLDGVEVVVSGIRTDPWDFVLAP